MVSDAVANTGSVPIISFEVFMETARLYNAAIALGLPSHTTQNKNNRYSAVRYVADKLDIHRTTVLRRLSWCHHFKVPLAGFERSAATEPSPRDYTHPALPSLEEDIEADIDRQASEFRRRREAQAAREWMKFEIHGNKPFALAYIGDPHLDDPNTDIGKLRDHVGIIRSTPRMWAVGLGDYTNGWVGRLARKYADQQVTERAAYARAKWLFDQDIWLLLVLGNHDAWKGGGSPFEWMINNAHTPLMEWEAKFELICDRSIWRIWAAHDFPGTSQWNILHGPLKRAMMTGGSADMFICGDKHSYGVLHTQHEHTGKPYWVGRARGYKMQDDYSRQCGYGEHDIGHSIVAVHDPRTGLIQCFDDLELGASYLRFLLERAG